MRLNSFDFQLDFFCSGDPEVLEDGPVVVIMGTARAGCCSCAAGIGVWGWEQQELCWPRASAHGRAASAQSLP